MVLQNGEYKIENEGIWVKKETLEELRDHYCDVADKCKNSFLKGEDTFKYPFYIGKADICKDLLKMFESLEGE